MLLPLLMNLGMLGASDSRPRPSDNEGGKRIFKPLGLPPERRKKAKQQTKVDDRVADTAAMEAEIAARLAQEFEDGSRRIEEQAEAKRIVEMSQAEIDFEIAFLLKKKLRTRDEQFLLTVLLIAGAA